MINFDDITPEMYDELNAEIEEVFEGGCHGECSSCHSDCSNAQFPKHAKGLYAVTGGKGGTGKSTITALLAVALAGKGLKVGILDADIPGSTQCHLFSAKERIRSIEKNNKNLLCPISLSCGVKLISYNLIAENPEEPVIYTGKDISNIVSYLYTDGDWAGLDIILIDMPSGAADVPLNLYSAFPIDGVIIVAEPSEVGAIPTKRCISLCSMLMSPPVAYIENKSLSDHCVYDGLYTLPQCVKIALPLSPDIGILGSDGMIENATEESLEPVVNSLAMSVGKYVRQGF